jgi:hypothetical protein
MQLNGSNSKEYLFRQHHISTIGKNETKNIVETVLKLHLLQTGSESRKIRVEILDIKQTNNEGLNGLAHEIGAIKKDIIFSINSHGNILQIENKEEVKKKWAQVKKEAFKKYDMGKNANQSILSSIDQLLENKGQLEQTMAISPLHSLLFPGVLKTSYTPGEQFIIHRNVPNFLPGIKLPVISSGGITDSDKESTTILLKGEVDKKSYEEDKVRQFVKTVTDSYNVKSELELKHTERYDLNNYNWLTEAGKITAYKLGEFCTCEMIHTLTVLN